MGTLKEEEAKQIQILLMRINPSGPEIMITSKFVVLPLEVLNHRFSAARSSPLTPPGFFRALRRAFELRVCAGGAKIDESVEKAWAAFGRIDALVNNAGVRGSVKNPPLLVAYAASKAALNAMIKISWYNVVLYHIAFHNLFTKTRSYFKSEVNISWTIRIGDPKGFYAERMAQHCCYEHFQWEPMVKP
ncbi:uncharacterized protein LOC120012440 [Tripterygium wilfordii]|uniref:uncharacterized protein LOC120012440 n=1 Tax=Tripterygium wilfordii TaxID=458696 RepID=UPI0018F81E42|nr:uncharacterized protein LOC120012440 [Tripterygium wilfordii]